MDLNIRVLKAVECCPTLYKGNASIEQRQVVWQQLATQMRVPESVLKTRWHLLCNLYQRCLEKRRSTDDANEHEARIDRNDFRYEAEMAFMMPYIHARIAIAAANAARKQQELALAGANDLTEPEFVITESDIEQATTASNELSAEYTFYEVETFEQEHGDLPDNGEVVNEMIENSHEALGESDYIQHIDESGNIVVQDIIYETGDQLSEDGGEIEVEDEELLQMGDQIEVQNEQIIEEVVEDEAHAQNEDEFITDKYDVMTTTEAKSPRTLRLPTNRGQKYIKVLELNPEKDEATSPAKQGDVEESPASFAQEYALTTRRRNAVVLKATPRVQVELTDNAAAANVVLQRHSENVESTADSSTPKNSNAVESTAVETPVPVALKKAEVVEESECNENKLCQIEDKKDEKSPTSQQTKPQEQVSTINSTASLSTSAATSTSSTAIPATTVEEIDTDNTKIDRSEDTIFGELVAAMLKKMPPERKRAIKRSIMDVLLT